MGKDNCSDTFALAVESVREFRFLDGADSLSKVFLQNEKIRVSPSRSKSDALENSDKKRREACVSDRSFRSSGIANTIPIAIVQRASFSNFKWFPN